MQYLCRMVTPVGGIVIDQFTGSGTSGLAAIAERLSFAGREHDSGYFEITKGRLGVGTEIAKHRP